MAMFTFTSAILFIVIHYFTPSHSEGPFPTIVSFSLPPFLISSPLIYTIFPLCHMTEKSEHHDYTLLLNT